MGKFFSNEVELALNYLYYGMTGEGTNPEEALILLNEAVAKDDVDAMFLLAKCYSDLSCIWRGHGILSNKSSEALFKKSILGGSSIGLLGAIGIAGLMEDYELRSYSSPKTLKAAYDKVYKMAEEGEAFCQYLVASAITLEDTFFIQGINLSNTNFTKDYIKYKLEALEWFKRSFEGGIYAAGNSLINIYSKGITGVVSPNKLKQNEIITYGAETLKNIEFMYDYYNLLRDRGDDKAAFEYTLKGMKCGDKRTFYRLGWLYMHGVGTEVNYTKAVECFENALSFVYEDMHKHIYGFLGQIYANGNEDIQKDLKKAVVYYIMADELDNTSKNDECALLLVLGKECTPNYKKAIELLERFLKNNKPTNISTYCQGLMYVEGLGYTQDIKKGMQYLKSVNIIEAHNKKAEFKRNIFGKWKRIQKKIIVEVKESSIAKNHLGEEPIGNNLKVTEKLNTAKEITDEPIQESIEANIIKGTTPEIIDDFNSDEASESIEFSATEVSEPVALKLNEDLPVSAPLDTTEISEPLDLSSTQDLPVSAPLDTTEISESLDLSSTQDLPVSAPLDTTEISESLDLSSTQDLPVSAPLDTEEVKEPLEFSFDKESSEQTEFSLTEETMKLDFNEEVTEPLELNTEKGPKINELNSSEKKLIKQKSKKKTGSAECLKEAKDVEILVESIETNFEEDLQEKSEKNTGYIEYLEDLEMHDPIELELLKEISELIEMDLPAEVDIEVTEVSGPIKLTTDIIGSIGETDIELNTTAQSINNIVIPTEEIHEKYSLIQSTEDALIPIQKLNEFTEETNTPILTKDIIIPSTELAEEMNPTKEVIDLIKEVNLEVSELITLTKDVVEFIEDVIDDAIDNIIEEAIEPVEIVAPAEDALEHYDTLINIDPSEQSAELEDCDTSITTVASTENALEHYDTSIDMDPSEQLAELEDCDTSITTVASTENALEHYDTSID
ncbi:hypothetical protein AN640_00565 [Candidatus Epulonipiscium fishelsonii]|uniref:Uncharacterized protein n=1 Tax=Candidatus Epulonipiscium fishelsonii TaxID=77094 RepID=A0ACC8X8Y4_9FIRM|nr:hypothetical protein AN640_00565 [Epulopiscium sp. SCG-D08WGA-EpuloA1]